MMSAVMLKGILLCIIILLAVCMGRLYDIFLRLPEDCEERGWVSWGIISEAVIVIWLAVKLIKG